MDMVFIWNDSLLIWNMIIIYGMVFLPIKTFFKLLLKRLAVPGLVYSALIERQETVFWMVFRAF